MDKLNILTFDLEDWFHILEHPYNKYSTKWDEHPSHLENIVQQILLFLKKHDTKATFFTLGWIGEKYPSLLKAIADGGHDIGIHTYYHTYLSNFTVEEFEKDLSKTKEVLFKASGYEPLSFRAPGFGITDQNITFLKLLPKYNILYDSSINVGFHTHGHFQKFPYQQLSTIDFGGEKIIEFPISTFGIKCFRFIYGGGGYFRAYPYFLTDFISNSANYNMYYFHPREFDVHSPRVPTKSFLKTKKLYQKVGANFSRLEKLLKKYKLQSVHEVGKELDLSLLKNTTFD